MPSMFDRFRASHEARRFRRHRQHAIPARLDLIAADMRTIKTLLAALVAKTGGLTEAQEHKLHADLGRGLERLEAVAGDPVTQPQTKKEKKR